MRPERVIIINNQKKLVEHVRKLLIKADYDPECVWPGDATVFSDWDTAFNKLVSLQSQGFNPEKTECFLLLDLALDDKNRDFKEGIGEITGNSNLLNDYIKVALTVWASDARKGLGSSVDGVIQETFTELEDHARASRMLDCALQNASEVWSERTKRKLTAPRPNYFVMESPGGRAVQAALSQIGINFLVQEEAVSKGWTNVKVRSLTGGFSGAHLVKIEGDDDGTPVSIVCKVSRDRRSLEREIERIGRAMESYEIFASYLVPPKSPPKEVGTDDAWYIVQATAPGHSIENLISASEEIDEPQLEMLVKHSSQLMTDVKDKPAMISPMPALEMTEQDIARFETTAQALQKLVVLCRGRGLISDKVLVPQKIEVLMDLVRHWNSRVVNAFNPAPHIKQHGDYNVRNIFIKGEKLQLIDFARYGRWPIGYDVTRLELQLLLRGIDTFSKDHEFPDRLRLWETLWEAVRPASPDNRALVAVDPAHAPLLKIIDSLARIRQQAFTRLVPDYTPEQQHRLISLMRAFDALKICSYQDTSVFKHVWFLQISMHAAKDASLFSA